MNSCSDSNPESSSNNDDTGSNHFARSEDYSSVAENDIDIEEDEDGEDLNEAASSLPRPPTKPNVHIDDLTICPVCTQAADDGDKHHLHYGGICCYSCRAFFRRAHQNTKEPNFSCRKNRRGNSRASSSQNQNQCGIDVKTRRQCQLCRYRRCLEIGMEPRWVLTSGQKKIRFRNLFKKRKSEKQNASTNHQDSAADDNDNANSNDSVPNQSREGPPQDVVPKRHFRSFSDDTLGSQDKTQTIPRTRISNDQPIQSTAIAEEDISGIGDICNPIYGSTIGMSSRHILRKHKFLQPQWLPPVKSDPSQAQSSSKSFMNGEFMKVMPRKTSTDERNGEVIQSHHRYQIGSVSPTESSPKSYTSRPRQENGFSPIGFNTLSRKLSSSDFNLSHYERDQTLNSRTNSEDHRTMADSEHRYSERYFNDTNNSSWRKRRCHDAYSQFSNISVQNNTMFEDSGIPRNKLSKSQPSFLIGDDADQYAVEHIRKSEKWSRQGHSDTLPMPRLVPHSYNHFKNSELDRLRQDMLSDNRIGNDENPVSIGKTNMNGLMLVPSADLMPHATDERSISFKTHLKERKTVVESRNFSNGQNICHNGDYLPHKTFQPNCHRSMYHSSENLVSEPTQSMISFRNRHTEKQIQDTSLSFKNSDFSAIIRCKETLVDSTVWLHKVAYDRKKKLEDIDNIFEKFVPAMRTTEISKDFIINLIDIHKRKTEEEKYSKDTSRKGHLLKLSMSQERKENDVPRLSIDQVTSHFDSLEEAFINFARSNKVFQRLSNSDQSQLLAKNSLLFVQYLFSRYFSSDVALEQLSWLLKGCGISLPIGFVDYSDLQYMSNVTFNDFTNVCRIIDPEDQSGEAFNRYSDSINTIKYNFMYPHYYNALIALMLLFSNDSSYHLEDRDTIEAMFQETKVLAITGYEEFVGFGINSLNLLICKLREMSYIWISQRKNYRPVIHKKSINRRTSDECFEKRNGIRTQVKPMDFSKKCSGESEILESNPVNHSSLLLSDYINYQGIAAHNIDKFQKVYLSITNGFVLSTIVDYTVGRTQLDEFRRDPGNIRFGKEGMALFLERFRRVLWLHSEVSDGLSDFDRSALWRSNFLMAGALCLSKMESALTGREQFMFMVGQLSEKINPFWELEFVGYHGLRSVNDIPKNSLKYVCCQRLSRSELGHYYSLLKNVTPIVRHPICFPLFTMILLLDTSNLIDLDISADEESMEDCENFLEFIDDESVPAIKHSQDEYNGASEPCSISNHEDQDNIKRKEVQNTHKQKKPKMDERFKEIQQLQKHYISLLRKLCQKLNDPRIKAIGESDKALNKSILCMKQLAQYVPVLM